MVGMCSEESYDWLAKYADVSSRIEQYVKNTDQILVVLTAIEIVVHVNC